MKLRGLSIFLMLALLLAFLSGCGGQTYTAVFYNRLHTDTSVVLYSGGTVRSGDELLAACEDMLVHAEMLFSRTDPTAELACLNAMTVEKVPLSAALADLVSLSLVLAEETGGLFDPTVGALSDLYDISGTSPLPDDEAITAALAYIGYEQLLLDERTLTRQPGVRLDFGAIAKGYLAEQLVAFFIKEGVRGGVLSLGGNVAVFGEKSDGSCFRVAVRSSSEEGGIVGVLSLKGPAYISTSGAYERYRVGEDGERYHHIFDRRTGRPAESDLVSVTVIDTNGARADALSTALFVGGYENALRFWESAGGNFEMVLVREDGALYVTPGLAFTPV